jgi:hypothetical protein
MDGNAHTEAHCIQKILVEENHAGRERNPRTAATGVSFAFQPLLCKNAGYVHDIESWMQSCLWRLRLFGSDIDGGQRGVGLRNPWALARQSGLLLDVTHRGGWTLVRKELLQAERARPCEIP